MGTQSVMSDYEMNSVFDWIERPLSTIETKTPSMHQKTFKRPQSRHQQHHQQPQTPLQQQQQKLQVPRERSSSVFETQSPAGRRSALCGSAITSFSCEPETAKLSPTKRLVTMENTYNLEPPAIFKPQMMQDMMKDVLNMSLQDKCYDQYEAPQLCKDLADVIKAYVMKLHLPRYKFTTYVTIGQNQGQGFVIGSRCLFDESRDSFTSASFQNKSLFAVATLFAANYE